MLVITRKPGQKVHLRMTDGRDVVVELVALQMGKVRIGFNAPSDVAIIREELLETEGITSHSESS